MTIQAIVAYPDRIELIADIPMGLSQIEFFDCSPVKEQQKTKINRLI
jgi:hypothetical protein